MTRSPDSVAVLSGCGILALLEYVEPIIKDARWLLLAITCLASFAGFVTSVLSSRIGVEKSISVRYGVRGAAMAAIVAGSIFALMARSLPGLEPVFRALLGGTLSIMPAMLVGMFAAGCGALAFHKPPPKGLPLRHAFSPPVPSWGLRILITGLVLAAVCLPPSDLSSSKPQSLISRLQPFAYTSPPAMASCNALQWSLSTSRGIPGVTASTVALSPDDQWLGYVSSNGTSLSALDLNSSVVRKADLPHPISRLALSQAADRAFVTSNHGPMEIGLVDLLANRYNALPKPRNRAMPDGVLWWWRDNEVLIVNTGQQWILNLDTLEVDEANSSESWSSLESASRSITIQELTGSLPESSQWAWQPATIPRSVELPEELGSQAWLVNGSMRLSIRSPERDARRIFDSITIENGDRILATRDGSKVIGVRGTSARIFYFDVGNTPCLKWTIEMPHPPAEGPDATRIATGLKNGVLRAFVYGRVTNPLNGKLVGPDRTVVLGMLTVLDWKEQTMTAYMSEFYGGPDAGVIVSDLHIQKEGRRELLKLNTPHRWWTELTTTDPASNVITAVPTNSERTKLLAASEEQPHQTPVSKAGIDQPSREAGQMLQESQRVEAMKVSPTTTPPSDPIKDFVINHHRKSQRGDAYGVAADYADRIDYFSDGLVDTQYILNDEIQYHASHRIDEESVQGDIRVSKLGNAGYTATYLIKIRSIDLKKHTLKEGIFEENLIIISAPNGFKISRQRAEKKQ